MSPLGYGAFKIGRNQGIKFEQGYDLPDDAAAERLLNGVLDLGVTYIDTAPAYGISEERIGRFLSSRRSEFVLSTKVGETFDAKSSYDFSRQGIRRSVEQSLRRLRTDVLDIVFLHAPINDRAVLADTTAASELVELRERGLIRSIGFSGHTADAFRLAMDNMDALMVEYSLQNDALSPVISEAAAQGKIVVVKKGLGSGRIPAEPAIRFVLNNPGVTSMLVSSLSQERMAENVRIARGVRNWD